MRLKRAIKRAALTAGRLWPGIDRGDRRVVFCYHSVHPNRPYASTTPHMFEQHILWLQEHCRLTSLDDLVDGASAKAEGRPVVAVTFDDGYEDNHSYALPILARHGATATFFITAGLVERDPAVVARFQRLWGCGPGDVVPLEWEQVRELRSNGMAIGAHGYSHRNLARLSTAELEREFRIPREIIGERIGEDVDLFAYPFGKPKVHVTPAVMQMAGIAGYRVAAAVTFRGASDPIALHAVPRFFADGDDLSKLGSKIRGDYEPIGWWQEHVPLSVIKVVSPQDFKG